MASLSTTIGYLTCRIQAEFAYWFLQILAMKSLFCGPPHSLWPSIGHSRFIYVPHCIVFASCSERIVEQYWYLVIIEDTASEFGIGMALFCQEQDHNISEVWYNRKLKNVFALQLVWIHFAFVWCRPLQPLLRSSVMELDFFPHSFSLRASREPHMLWWET